MGSEGDRENIAARAVRGKPAGYSIVLEMTRWPWSRSKYAFLANVSGEARWGKPERGNGAGAGGARNKVMELDDVSDSNSRDSSRRPREMRLSPSSSTALFA